MPYSTSLNNGQYSEKLRWGNNTIGQSVKYECYTGHVFKDNRTYDGIEVDLSEETGIFQNINLSTN